MREKTIAAVALENRDYPSFEAKLAEAARWVSFAAQQGADLVVLPELLNLYRGDGAGNTQALRLEDVALDDWQRSCAAVIEAAVAGGAAVVIPVAVREPEGLSNSFFLVDARGQVAGQFRKNVPTPSERAAGVVAGGPSVIEWEGLKIGGAICFDCYHPAVFEAQARLGAQLFVVPSLTPAAGHLEFYALHHGTPIVQAYPAWSRIIDLDGRELAAAGYRGETLRFGFGTPVVMAAINFERVSLFADVNQLRIVELQRAYGRRVRVTFDQPNVSFALESREPGLTIDHLIREFGLVRRGDYFARTAPNA